MEQTTIVTVLPMMDLMSAEIARAKVYAEMENYNALRLTRIKQCVQQCREEKTTNPEKKFVMD